MQQDLCVMKSLQSGGVYIRFKRLYIKGFQGGGDDGTLALGKLATFDRKKFLTVL